MSLLKLPAVASAASPQPGAQDRRDHLRHRGLAVAAGDGDQRQRRSCARQPAASAPSAASVSALRGPGRPAASRPRSASAATAPRGLGVGEEVVGVEALALQRDEQIARRAACACRCARAGSASRARRRGARRADPRGAWPSVIIGVASRQRRSCRAPSRERARAHAPRRRTRCARPRSPGRPRGPCRRSGPRLRPRLGDRVARSPRRGPRSTSTASWPIAPTQDLADDRAGFSLRGLSLVTTTRSACAAATAPISGRLAASRSPPQPNTHHSAPPRCLRERRAARRAPCPARRACARSRRRPPAAGRAPRSGAPCGPARRQRRARRAASASDTPSARSAPSTPSRFATLYWPISCVASAARSVALDHVEARPSRS